MDQQEYDRLYKSQGPLPPAVDQGSAAPKIVQAFGPPSRGGAAGALQTALDRENAEMQRLAQAGADYAGREEIKSILRQLGGG